MNSKMLQTMVEQATSAELPKPDMALNKKVCQFIREDESLAPEAVRAIKSRLVKKNPRIQCLALELLDIAVKSCPGAFHQCVAREEFMGALAKLVRFPELSPIVQNRILALIQMLAQHFKRQSDQYPIFQNVYELLKDSGYVFPEPTSMPTAPKPSRPAAPAHSHSYPAPKPKAKNFVTILTKQDRHAKLRKDLRLLIDNLKLTNEIIDGEDYRVYKENEVLKDLISTLKISERNLQGLVDNLNDEELLSVVLLINDDLQKTFSRYKDLTSNRMPEEYSSAFEPERPPAKKQHPHRAPAPPQRMPEEYTAPPAPAPAPKVEAKKPASVAPETIFSLFDNPEESKKQEAPEENIFMSPLKPVASPETKPATGESDAINRLNNIMKQMQLKDTEEQKLKTEEAKNTTESTFPNPYGMSSAPMMNPQMMQYMTNMTAFNPMSFYGANPYMTNYGGPAMSRPMYPTAASGPLPFQPIKASPKTQPEKPPEPKPEVKDEFTELFDLANATLTTKPQPVKKSNPFDEELFPANGNNKGYGGKPVSDPAAELFGGVKSEQPGNQRGANELFEDPAPRTQPPKPPQGQDNLFDLF